MPRARRPTSAWRTRALDNGQVSSYSCRVRRKKGVLIPIEAAILRCAVDLQRRGEPEFHGFFIAKELRDRDEARRLTAHGTLYKALERLEKAGLVQSRWEDPEAAASERRPRRRLYQVTGLGERVATEESRSASPSPRPKPGLEPA
jgi:PadR family transcriptional regulator PadR